MDPMLPDSSMAQAGQADPEDPGRHPVLAQPNTQRPMTDEHVMSRSFEQTEPAGQKGPAEATQATDA
eukprot:scaffold568592_cov13-Prasinocladus_malaysianus.AAC.1